MISFSCYKTLGVVYHTIMNDNIRDLLAIQKAQNEKLKELEERIASIKACAEANKTRINGNEAKLKPIESFVNDFQMYKYLFLLAGPFFVTVLGNLLLLFWDFYCP